MPQVKLTKYKLRNKSSKCPKINTSRFMNTFIKFLNFKYNNYSALNTFNFLNCNVGYVLLPYDFINKDL